MASIRVQKVSKVFRPSEKYRSVYDLDFEVIDSEFFCFLGPTNSGKTEILRLIAGLEKPDSGKIFIDDKEVNDIDPSKRRVAMLFETLALYPNKNAFDNIASPLKIKKVAKTKIRESVMAVVELMRIEHLIDRTPETYSGGEKQRVALGRILVQRPDVYLLDEPLGGLDARLRIAMGSELKRIQRDLGQTMVFVSHDQEETMSMGNRIAVLKEGRIQQVGTPQELYNHPVNFCVAKSIGKPAMNSYSCILTVENRRTFAAHADFRVDIEDLLRKRGKKPKGEEIILGIRPEDIDVCDAKTTDEDIPAMVYVVEQLGAKAIVDFKLGDETIRTILSADERFKINDKRWLRFRNEKIHIFEKTGGEAVV